MAELRIPHTTQGTISGYFADWDLMAKCAAEWTGKAPGVYITLNPVRCDLLARATNRTIPFSKHTTADADIVHRRWLPIDFDPVRPAGISATNKEHQAARERAWECRRWLCGQGWEEMILGDSGNGAHLLARIALPKTAESSELVKRCLASLDFHFSDSVVKVDTMTFNSVRIWKLYGTVCAKGDATADCPHRRAHFVVVPDEFQLVRPAQLEKLAASLPNPAKDSSRGREKFDLGRWIEEHHLPLVAEGPWNSGHKWILNPCLWNVPRGQSLRARVFVLEASPSDVNWDILTRCQEQALAGAYERAMAGFLLYLAPQYDRVCSGLRAKMMELRRKAMASAMHKRTPEIVANLGVGIGYFLDYAVAAGVFDLAEKDAFWNRAWKALGEAAKSQAEQQAANDPAKRFIELLASAISSGRAHVAGADGGRPEQPRAWGWALSHDGMRGAGVRAGWVNGEGDLFLNPDTSYAVIQAVARDIGEPLGLTSRTLHKRLKERGLLVATSDVRQTLTVRRVLEGRRREVLHLRANVLGVCMREEPDQPDPE